MLANNVIFRALVCLLLLVCSPLSNAAASLSLAESPLFVGARATPMVMLNTSRDHQLFYKAYNDYTDLDLDGTLDTSYLNTFDYYGYFDSYKCYFYDSSLGRFVPVATASGSKATVKAGTSHYCSGSAPNNWSGNFLNWLSMSRIDVMRKVLYGGYRSTDTAAVGATPALTVLERANIPTDGHAWAKYYANTDIDKLTPFSGIATTPTTNTGNMTGVTTFTGTVSARKVGAPYNNAVERVTVTSGGFVAGDSVTITTGTKVTTGTVVSYGTSPNLLIITVTGKSGGDTAVGDTVTVTNTAMGTPAGCSSCIRVSGIYYPGDQIVITHGAGPSISYGVVANTMASGYVSLANLSGPALPAAGVSVNVSNRTRTGISFCNLTAAPAGARSESTTAPPVIRAANGNYALWGANERWQCYWRDEKDGGSSTATPDATNGNTLEASGMAASRRGPLKAEAGLSLSGVYDFIARVEVCKSALIGQETCKAYGTNSKPTGLLQLYGEGRTPRILFGLMTPSYTLNVSGGVLRKALGKSLAGNISSDGVTAQPDEDEIDPNTGQFKTDTTKTGATGIIHTLNKLRIDAYDYTSGTYKVGTTDCDYQRTGIVPVGTATVGNQVTEGRCSSWGNPMSELYMESLRYLAGKTPTPGFTSTLMIRDDAIGNTATSPTGLKQITSWVDPISAQNYCAPLSVLVFNASVSTNDKDQVSGFADLLGAPNAVSQTDKVGVAEGLVGTSVFIGNNGTINNGICTAKNVAGLGSLGGICPEAPSQSGSYLMAGMAYYAHTNRIRDVTSVTIDSADTTSLRVKTYGVALATNVPRIPVKVGGKTVYIQPAYRLDLGASGLGTGTIVDFKVVSQTATSGTFYVNWEDSNFGGDYDQDVIGTISYQVLPSDKIRITTKIISESTANPQGFGYVIAGTNRDGPHFHSGIRGFTFTDTSPGAAVSPSTKVDCSAVCNVGDVASSVDYTATTGSTIVDLKDPLYYASKYGGFKEYTAAGVPIPITISSIPDRTIEWDAENKDGDAVPDGQPDTYFYVIDPAQLEKSLARAFQAISRSSGGATVATSSSSLDTGLILYQGQFDPGYWTGDLLAYDAKEVSGSVGATLAWSAASKLTSHTGRVIFTSNSTNAGLPFQWASLSLTQKRSLEIIATTPTTSSVDQGVVEYVRGNAVNEGSGISAFRTRDTTKLGDIINSAPIMVGPRGSYGLLSSVPAAYAGDSTYLSYAPTRTNIVYVGANDGMLHAFDATTSATGGKELFAYVPSMVIPNLKQLVNPAYTHKYYVDGSPAAADVKLTVGAATTTSWRTVVAGALGAGVRGLYALDVTSPDYSSESSIKDTLLWEFTHSELGYVVTRPMLTRLKNDKWALVTGNGYNSASGKAQLFIIYLDQKGVAPASLSYLKIDTGVGSTTDTNGLGGVAGIDIDNDGYVDYVYGGDLQGNMWKFDLNDPTSESTIVKSKLGIACRTATTTCTAANTQPITSEPALTPHPVNSQHVLVYFGTGKFLENSDIADKSLQSMYGVWDQATTSSGARTTVLQTRDKLLTQTFSPDTTTTSFRQISNLPMDWSTKSGWVEDLIDTAVTGAPNSGERITGAPVLYKKALFYATFVPSALLCGISNAHGWLTVVNYENGGLYATFDINGDGKIDKTELAASKINNSIGGLTLITTAGAPIAITSKTGSDTPGSSPISSSSAGSGGGSSSTPPGGCPVGMDCTKVGLPGGEGRRLSWREVIKPE